MNIDLHSHFFPIEALSNPGKYQNHAPKLVLDKGKLSVTSQIGMRAGLGEGAYDAPARIKALDEMSIDLQAISPSPILLRSADLQVERHIANRNEGRPRRRGVRRAGAHQSAGRDEHRSAGDLAVADLVILLGRAGRSQIGRASCRERV